MARRASEFGKPPPNLQPWKSIERRILFGHPRRHCGAGVDALAVATNGSLYPCYRFATEPGGERYRLGDICRGLTEKELVSEFAGLRPDQLQPQQGTCATCPVNHGCGHFCPASGALLGDGIRSVPTVVCQLVRAQVSAIRPYVVPLIRPRRSANSPLSLPMLAIAAASAVACNTSSQSGTAIGRDAQAGDAAQVAPGPGIRADFRDAATSLSDGGAELDAGADATDGFHYGGGVCAIN